MKNNKFVSESDLLIKLKGSLQRVAFETKFIKMIQTCALSTWAPIRMQVSQRN